MKERQEGENDLPEKIKITRKEIDELYDVEEDPETIQEEPKANSEFEIFTEQHMVYQKQ